MGWRGSGSAGLVGALPGAVAAAGTRLAALLSGRFWNHSERARDRNRPGATAWEWTPRSPCGIQPAGSAHDLGWVRIAPETGVGRGSGRSYRGLVPSVGRFLELLEAVSRRDWTDVSKVVREVAEEERNRKHFTAAHQLLSALEVATSDAGYDRVGTLSLTTPSPTSHPLHYLARLDVSRAPAPVLPKELTAALRELVAEWQHEAELRAEGLHPRNTLLMYGPPGCGKTHVARHLAEALSMPIYLVRFDGLVSAYLGETASNLAQLFEFFSANRCLLLLDEIDAIAKLRDDRNELGELKRVVISLLQSIDYADTRSLLVAATNHPHLLDPALWRRFEVVWEIPPPDGAARRKILTHHVGVGVDDEVLGVIEEVTKGMSGADMVRVGDGARRRRVLDRDLTTGEAVLLSVLEQLVARQRPTDESTVTEAVIHAALALRAVGGPSSYSFKQLERLSGVPHSTLHHRAKAAS